MISPVFMNDRLKLFKSSERVDLTCENLCTLLNLYSRATDELHISKNLQTMTGFLCDTKQRSQSLRNTL